MERINLIHNPEKKGLEYISHADLEEKFCSLIEKYKGQLEMSTLSYGRVEKVKNDLTGHFIAVATDLAYQDLAKGHIERLLNHVIENGARNEFELLAKGAQEFFKISKDIFGPLWASYVDLALSTSKGTESILFASRDATPIYWAFEGVVSQSNNYNLDMSKIVHVDWNRWFMGQEDETDKGKKPLPFNHPLMQTFYKQMGFSNGQTVKIVEPGVWGSAANALKNVMPDQKFELWFMFSHMPDRIFGFLNESVHGVEEGHFEMINDSQEALPKGYTRPEDLVELPDGTVTADISTKIINSPYMEIWPLAVALGAYQAGVEFGQGNRIDVKNHTQNIISLSELSKNGVWTGILPDHTPTWSDGEKWRKDWKWGQIPPLK